MARGSTDNKVLRHTDPPYVEVVGEGQYDEEVRVFVLELTLRVSATMSVTAARRDDILTRRCLQALTAAGGLRRDEIEDAGVNLWRPWWGGRKARDELIHRLVIRCDDRVRLAKALSAVEKSTGRGKTVGFNMRQPVFDAKPEVRDAALRGALAAARRKSEALASECGASVGRVLLIEEEGSAVRPSGAIGDDDWFGDAGRFDMARRRISGLRAAGPEPEPLESPSRTVWVNYRVRFELLRQ